MKTFTLATSPYTLLAFLIAAFCLSSIEMWHTGYGWHDQQRIYQLLLLCACAPLSALTHQRSLPRAALLLLGGLLLLGLCSSALASWPQWALKEWTRYAGLLLLALFVGGMKENSAWHYFILWAITAVGCIHTLQFLVYYIAAFITEIRMLNADILFSGFSNPRFFGQFQVMLMPVMLVLFRQCYLQQRGSLAILLGLALVIQWCIAFLLGGRGLWLGLAVSHFALLLINRQLRLTVGLQLGAALLGFALFIMLFKLIPFWLGLDPVIQDGLRTSLSGRESIWQSALGMAIANPWLGVGPMHFAATYNPVAAHPHQVILQWLAEWGFPATSLVLILGAWGLLHGARCLRRASANELDAGLWVAIAGALILAQVDGIFVMPYAETWLAFLIGLALARWAEPVPSSLIQRLACAILAIPVLVILVKVLLIEAPNLPQASEAYMTEHHTGWTPRFWLQGWIPM